MSSDTQNAKQVVLAFFRELDSASPESVENVLTRYTSEHYQWRGCHPFNEITSLNELSTSFWQPLKQSLKRIQRRQDVLMAAQNSLSDTPSVWVVSMGHLMGLLDQNWLGIPATHKMTFLRYCEFHEVSNGKIQQTAMFFDIPHLMVQAGVNPFPPQTGAFMVQPGPMTHNGVMVDAQPSEESDKTLTLINSMISDIGNWKNALSLEEELALTWHDDMIWWGPAGIGASYTIERYAKQHSGPFREAFDDRIFNGHICRLAEGEFGGFFGWPNLTLTPRGGFMGMPAFNKPVDMRVIDIYRRDGDKLAENWVFIDLLHFWHQQGLDVLGRLSRNHPSLPL
ncbi:ester cyclase [Vibrio sp. S9_S30]|uniref:nuclear transport factor 2 family protein n=1 Tax=Vibrio sp. S9_S30 TaxID=2720226 RepID=UPI001680F838|nr:ester cyclase [Vibrio sp. S9_S30]MBD1557755.1 ester cyclase [Vibrio sp. S9_S30]